MEKYTYHFSLHLHFKQDVNVDKLEKHFNYTAYKKNMLKDSKGIPERRTAKLWFKSDSFTEINVDEKIEEFVKKIYNNFHDLKDITTKFDGDAVFSLIFTETKERPIISLTTQTIQLFAELGLSFDVDFC